MSEYFSRIARAGGARFSGEGVRTSATKAPTKRDLSPIDSEETVMLSPSEPRSSRETGLRKKPRVDEVSPNETRRGRSADRTDPADSRESASPSRSDEGIPHKPVEEETRLIETHGELHRTASDESDEDVNATAPNSSVTTFDSPASDAIRPEASEKRFFENTAAIVEGQPAEPAEAQTIVLREVQEWIAAGHIPSAEIIPEDKDERAVPDRYEKLEPSEREHGVVRIVDRDRRGDFLDSERKTSPRPSIEEQNFEVSIGSISVVVEGDDPLPQAAQAVVTRPAPAQEPTRSVSRLSRHYL